MPERGDTPAAGAREAVPSWRMPAVGVELLVILDGASEPPRPGLPTSLERAATPALDGLCAEGALTRLRTVAPWLEAGSEHAIPALLGWTPPAPVDRGVVEAAARGIAVREGQRAWRIDVRRAADGTRAAAAPVLPALAAALPSHRLHLLGGHRLLAVGTAKPDLPAAASSADGGVMRELPPALDGLTFQRWPEGIVPPRLLDERTVMISAPGAAAGIARLLGGRVVTPTGATGRPGSDLAAKANAALEALDRSVQRSAGTDGAGRRLAERIVVHVGAPDEAAHDLDVDAKVAALEAADRDLISPLMAATASAPAGSVTLTVCPDHGCDPRDGRHDAAPVPCVTWTADAASRFAQPAPTVATDAPRSAQDASHFAANAPRLTERAVARLSVTEPAARERAAA